MHQALTMDFISDCRGHLLARRARKLEILASGGTQAIFHSPKDIVRIDFALKRMDQGQYGLCVYCGLLIGHERLRIFPETLSCMPCAASSAH